MFKYLFWAIALYLLVRFIVNFVIPVYRATRQMKSQVREFQEKMQGQEPVQENFGPKNQTKSSVKEGDYIDFEEIK